MNTTTLSKRAKEKLLVLDDIVKKPFVLACTDGYTRFFSIMYTTGIVACFVAAICLSPIFASEYTTKTDQLILSSRNGKKSLILAKLFTGLTLSGGICSSLTILTYFECMMVFGVDGANTPIQLYLPLSTYPLTMLQMAVIFSLCILFANLLMSSIALLLSAKLKTPFGVIIIMSILTIAPMFMNASESNAVQHNMLALLPTNMMGLWMVTSPFLFEVFGCVLQPYIFMPMFAGIVTVFLMPFSYRMFKNHQIQ